jgi:hypothetical protein
MLGCKSRDPPPMAVVKTTVAEMVSLGKFLGREAAVPREILGQMGTATRARLARAKAEEERKAAAEERAEAAARRRDEEFRYRKTRDQIEDERYARARAEKAAKVGSGIPPSEWKTWNSLKGIYDKVKPAYQGATEYVPFYEQKRRAATFEAMKRWSKRNHFDMTPWGGPDYSVAPPPHMPRKTTAPPARSAAPPRPGATTARTAPPAARVAPSPARPAPVKKSAAPGGMTDAQKQRRIAELRRKIAERIAGGGK